jgi:hypothetical protein
VVKKKWQNKMISKHISDKEGNYSRTALRRGIDNTPEPYHLVVKSQHCEGRAIDIDDTFGYKTNAEMFEYIKNNLDFDQLIWEFGDNKNPDWVHVSYVSIDENRRRILKAYKLNGKTTYKII